MLRCFTVQALENCDLLTLTIADLKKLATEFPAVNKELMINASDLLVDYLRKKVDTIKQAELE
jgi:hypothetical protein